MAGTPWQLRVGQLPNFTFTYSPQEARRVLYAFAFACCPLRWRADRRVGVQPTGTSQFRWAYRIYDCALSTTPNVLTVEDVALTAALNSGIDAKTMLTIAAIAPEVSGYLRAASTQPPFWQLTADDLTTYRAGSPAAPLWDAWAMLKGVAGTDIAIPHKILHRKRPEYFPLLDGSTVLAYPPSRAWAGIRDDLRTQAHQFSTLEGWFNGQAQAHGGTALTRLRIHDVLLWSRTSGQFQALEAAGAALGC